MGSVQKSNFELNPMHSYFHKLLKNKIHLLYFGDNCIQNFHWGGILSDIVGNLVLLRHASRALKCDFQTYIRLYTSQNKNFVYGLIPILMRFFSLASNYCDANSIKPQKCVHHQMKCDVIDEVKLFLTVYRRICHNFLMLSNQPSHYKSKCIRITFL